MRAPSLTRQILNLAVPAFVALVAEPLFLLVDSAIIGHLGTPQLAGLGIAGSVLSTAVGVFVFLAYGTTAAVARALGAGASDRVVSAGVDGTVLALLLGVVSGSVATAAAPWLCAGLGASGEVLVQAVAYLRVSAIGLPAMLVVLAITGALRGVQDTRTPLIVSVAGFSANALLNWWFVYGLGWGIAGSAWGTVIAQLAMALALVAVWVSRVRRSGATLRLHPAGVLAAATSGVPLLVRTLALRAVLLLTTWVAAALGEVPLAAHQVAFTVWTLLAFALDALAIAGQALTGKGLGAADVAGVRQATAVMVRWGVIGGAVVGAVVAVAGPFIAPLFTTDPAVRSALVASLIVVGIGQPVAGYVFVVDGVLIGAGDGRWLAGGMIAVLVGYLPVVAVLRLNADALAGQGAVAATVALWLGFTAFMLIRSAMLWWRERGDAWLVTGLG
ncbi:MATE family efflux transporter [Micropruina sonneratiae]|uniref:MATE family efflux transporter n=1 Tax=Micropruina sonneratiae TaxID=2986940 RepID=UPI00222781DF|nr:MATE family efflux transporter [Micropruina sp. KQZ13P-5]MCW3157813.1 MATE family efflux transporter [Micropruina sp. KQZ13P-5]